MGEIKIKDLSPEAQKNYNIFFQKMIDAKSEDEKNFIVEEQKKKAIDRLKTM